MFLLTDSAMNRRDGRGDHLQEYSPGTHPSYNYADLLQLARAYARTSGATRSGSPVCAPYAKTVPVTARQPWYWGPSINTSVTSLRDAAGQHGLAWRHPVRGPEAHGQDLPARLVLVHRLLTPMRVRQDRRLPYDAKF